ncbi:MAG: VOC family protein [Myxococcota bacterium]
MTNPVVWFEVMGQDAAKLRSFYGELLGWEFQVDEAMDYGVVEAGIAGGIGKTGNGGWVTFYTQVPDLSATIARAKGLGSVVVVPETDLADVTIAVVSDPEGHPVGLCTPRPKAG